MKTELVISRETAVKLYPKADQEFKEMLKATFGENIASVTERIKTYEDAC